MAQYKVPQDVEADDKLLGPFSFRQFVYLLIAGGLIAIAVGLWQLFPLLVLIPVPFVLFFLILALPLKKDQPMETYLAALVSYYLKPRTRLWTPGQRESTILITAPKIVEEARTRDISGEEATHRLSFLADIVDTEGYAIKGASGNPMREDLIAEANATVDMFDKYETLNLEKAINRSQTTQQQEVRENMQTAIQQSEAERLAEFEKKMAMQRQAEQEKQAKHNEEIEKMRGAIARSEEIDMSGAMIQNQRGSIHTEVAEVKKSSTIPANHSIMELANNTDFTVATIAKEANRIKGKDEGEVFISLH